MTRFLNAKVLPLVVLTLSLSGFCTGCIKVRNTDGPVTIRFAAKVNNVPFDCSQTYTDVGTTRAVWQPQDFRMYVTNPRLVRQNGQEVSIVTDHDGVWQDGNVVLLDFEDAQGTCQNGTPAVNTQIRGTVAHNSDYAGLKFTMAVPFFLDHQDASSAMPPLDQAGLFWGWQVGYKFLSIDGKVNHAAGSSLHIGSTGCTMDGPNRVKSCRAPNEAQIYLPIFDASKHTVVADIGILLKNSALTVVADSNMTMQQSEAKQDEVSGGCMSEPSNTACAPIFLRLGLPFGQNGANTTAQSFFSAQ